MAKGAEVGRRTRALRAMIVCILSLSVQWSSARSILQRRITVHAERVRLSAVLTLIAKEGDFRLSYNAATVPGDSLVDVHAEGERVEAVLKEVLPKQVQWKESGNHIIITGSKERKQRFSVTGRISDAATGRPIERAALYEVRRNNIGLSDAQGMFTLDLTGDLERTPVLITRHGYHDTVVHVPRAGMAGNIILRPLDRLERLAPRCDLERCAVEDLGVARLLVPSSRMDRAAYLDVSERRDRQVSLIPTIGTNGAVSGSIINRASLNIIGGYARGLEGVEVAGGVNLLRNDMKGLQIAGMGNVVGGVSDGVQIAGGANHVMGMVKGFQLAGASNTAWDTLSGVQLAGAVNLVRKGMTGTQIGGALNIALGDMDGVQVSGGVNASMGAVNKAQVAGALNYAHAVAGAQVTAGMNVALGPVGGGQVGLAANYAADVAGGQVSFGANVAIDTVTGGQFGFASNYARVVEGGQITFGINLATHTVRGAQVGVVNFARRALGAQVGILNISDTISGAAIGLLTIARTGYHRFDMVHTDVLPMSLHLRTGVRHFHNILGYSPAVEASGRWGFLYGFGSYGVLVADRFSLAAGPVLNGLVTDHRDADTGAFLSTLIPANNLLDQVDGNTRFGLWMGWNLALGVRF